MKLNRRVSRIDNDVQDRSSDAWKALCRYIDELEASGADEFAPCEALGPELYAGIFTLPESIGKLKRVTKVHLYGSKLKRIPPEIGEMTALTYFDVYTSYGLEWVPYELTRCKNLIDSRVSTRALYGNYKHRLHFPPLQGNPFRYVALLSDITKKKASEELIWRQANFDALTGLPNRRMFHQHLRQEMKKTDRS